MARVLLLNPPVRGRAVLRDFACGETTKADYYWAPIDLLVLSGVLSLEHELQVVDAVVEELSPADVLRRVRPFRPDAVFTLTAAVTLDADDAFLGELKEATGARIYGLGDVAQFAAEQTLARTRSFDGFVQNFGDPALCRLAAGELASASSVVLRTPSGPDVRAVALQSPLRYPRPRHELFPLHRYRMPFSRWTASSTILTTYGCPFPCTFCNSNALPWQVRSIEDVVEEMLFVRRLGVREIFLRDFTFGPSRKRAHALCEAMVAAKVDLRWTAECRLDVLDEPLLEAMRRAGCEVILVGVEVGDAEVSARLGKRLDATRTWRILQLARKAGMRVGGHFVLGSPEETRAQIEETIRFACALPLDYAAFNLYAPRLGTPLRSKLVQLGKLSQDDLSHQDVSAQANAFAQIESLELKRMLARAVLSFYGRPSQLVRLAGNTPWSALARQGWGVVRGIAGSKA